MSVIEPHIHDLTFDGTNLSTFGVHVSGNESYKTPEKAYEVVEVPGRSGDLHFDLGRYKNLTISYPAFIGEDLETNFINMIGYLLSRKGYCVLKDTYHPGYFRLGEYKGPLDPEIILLQAGVFTLEFDCKPQRYLDEVNYKIDPGTRVYVTNPTYFNAFPTANVYGNGTFTIKDTTVTLTDNSDGYVSINFETMDCVKVVGTTRTNHNSKVTFSGAEFEGLPEGRSYISTDSNTTVYITPRWWTL